MKSFTDDVAIVTGGSSGPGRLFARALARAGYCVVVVYLGDQSGAEATVDEIIAADGTAISLRADVTDELDVERLFTETLVAFGRVDVVVHADRQAGRIVNAQAVCHLRAGGGIVDAVGSAAIPLIRAQQLRSHGIVVIGHSSDGSPSRIDAGRQVLVLDQLRSLVGGSDA